MRERVPRLSGTAVGCDVPPRSQFAEGGETRLEEPTERSEGAGAPSPEGEATSGGIAPDGGWPAAGGGTPGKARALRRHRGYIPAHGQA